MKKALVVSLLALVMGLGFSGTSLGGEVGVTDKEIVIGSHQDLSGPIAVWGIRWKQGLEFKAREINEAGGIHGRKIRLVIEDNAYDPKKAIMVTNKMINRDKVFMFVGNMGSPTAGATKPIISRKKIPQLAPATAASLFFDPHDRYSFAGFTPYYDQARIVIKWFMKNKKYTKFGLMYQDDEMGSIMKKGFEDQLALYKMKLVAAESYKRGATEFSSQIAKLRKAGSEVVCLATIVRETVGALKEAKKVGWDVQMAGLSPTANPWVHKLALKAGFSANGFLATTQAQVIYEDSALQTVRDFWKKHVEWMGNDPDSATTGGVSGIHLFAEAAKRAGRNLTREGIVDAFETFRDFKDETFGGPPWTYTKTNHQGCFGAILHEVQKDKFRPISKPMNYKD